jgi:hypothetical protein
MGKRHLNGMEGFLLRALNAAHFRRSVLWLTSQSPSNKSLLLLPMHGQQMKAR